VDLQWCGLRPAELLPALRGLRVNRGLRELLLDWNALGAPTAGQQQEQQQEVTQQTAAQAEGRAAGAGGSAGLLLAELCRCARAGSLERLGLTFCHLGPRAVASLQEAQGQLDQGHGANRVAIELEGNTAG
jgi:hypothetical protein